MDTPKAWHSSSMVMVCRLAIMASICFLRASFMARASSLSNWRGPVSTIPYCHKIVNCFVNSVNSSEKNAKNSQKIAV